jgi:hypothetical protein
MRWHCVAAAAVALLGLCTTGQTRAQGLIWSLPEDGAWVRFEGTYKQLVRRPDSTAGDLQLQWTRHLTIKSVGTSEEAWQDQVQPCRWIEIKVITGQEKEGLIDAGPGGTRIYKLLVPEAAIAGQVLDAEGILVSHIPVVRGFRKVGDEDPQPIESGVFQVYPLISFLQHYRNLAPESSDPVQEQIPSGLVSATVWKGSLTMESRTDRSSNQGQIWRTDEVPFGIAKWFVRDVREEKHPTQSRDLFRETMEVELEMAAHEIGTGAETELITD